MTLVTEALEKRYGGVVAVDGLSLAIADGARHALIGPNGAGKTTVLDLLSGLVRPTRGRILLDGEDITRLAPHVRARRGLARTFQINRLFPSLTPVATLDLALAERGVARSARAAGIEAILDRVGLAQVMTRPAATLAYGQQRLLEIALALACQPRLLLLDEPTAGVPEAERHQIRSALGALPADVTIVLVEHDMDVVFAFADRITVLVNGAILAQGPPAAVAADARVRAAYLGEG